MSTPGVMAPHAAGGAADQMAAEERPTIDVVFCIDCSGSMGGVIETAKQKVWAIVNQVARSKPAPVLRIGLIGYGNSDQTYRQFDLTDDLDGLYKNLLTFKDEGWGTEWVGRAAAVHRPGFGSGGGSRKVRAPQGRVVANSHPG